MPAASNSSLLFPGLPPVTPAAPARRRRRWPVVAGVLVLLVLVAGGLTAFFLTRDDGGTADGVQAHNALGGLVDLPHGLRSEPRASWSFHGGTVQWAAASEGDVFVAAVQDDRAELLRLAGSDGSVRWRTEAPVGEVSTMHVADGVLLVSLVQSDAATASLEAFDADTGAPAWRYERPAVDILGSLADDGHTVALVQTPDDTAEVVVLDRAGAEVWKRPVDDVAAEGDDVLVQSGGDVTMVDLASGEDRWSVPAGEGVSIGLVGGRSVVADRRTVSAYDRGGTQLWRQDLPADDPGGVYGQGDGLAVIVRNSSVVALAVADGARKWEAPFSGIVTDTAPTRADVAQHRRRPHAAGHRRVHGRLTGDADPRAARGRRRRRRRRLRGRRALRDRLRPRVAGASVVVGDGGRWRRPGGRGRRGRRPRPRRRRDAHRPALTHGRWTSGRRWWHRGRRRGDVAAPQLQVVGDAGDDEAGHAR